MVRKLSIFRVITYALLIVLILLVFGAFLFIPFLQNELYIKKNLNSDIYSDEYSDVNADDTIYSSVLRFHVRANSDSEKDQQVKIKVRDAVLSVIQKQYSMKDNQQVINAAKEDKTLSVYTNSKDDMMKYIDKHKAELIAVANEVLKEEGFGYVATAYLTRENFPIKQYGDLTFPAGEYDAFRVDLGEAAGHNWWCVLYPSLCFVDVTSGVVPEESKEELQSILPAEDYEELLSDPDTEIEVRSKLWDVISDWF